VKKRAAELKRDISSNEIEITNQTVLLDSKKKEISTINAVRRGQAPDIELTSVRPGLLR